MLGPTAHEDTFTRDNLPPEDQWPDFLLDGFDYPDYLNAAVELTDAMVEKGFGDRTALIGNGRRRTYKELADWTNRLAHALVADYGVRPGNRVLIRSANNPAMVACWLAATKAGAVVVNTMPMLRAAELGQIVDKAEIRLALCDTRMMDEIIACAKTSRFLKTVVGFDGTANHDAELDRSALGQPVHFDAVRTGRDDVALLGFTSGTTGRPKATMHFHRDLLIIADAYAREVLQVTPDDIFVGSPPLAFTFGLGGLAIFPLRFGATATLLENAAPPSMIEIIETYRATISFTAPTAYRAMLRAMDEGADLSSLRVAVSAGETLPAPVYEEWRAKTGTPILDGIGTTELLHIFISNRLDEAAPGATGRPVTGYEARVVDQQMKEVPRGTVGRLAVRGPTGCRYLADERQSDYVCNGWNLTGDAFSQDEDGTFHFAARTDDMIISSGYNIAGPEVEAALLAHAHVSECAVIGIPDEERGHIVEAHIVLAEGVSPSAACIKRLQDHVKGTIAPYKYPRSVKFCESLPKTQTGKVQRFRLREEGQGGVMPDPTPAEDTFKHTRDLFDLPPGCVYLDGNSLGPLPRAVRERVTGTVDREWGEGLIRGWNDAGWMDLPARVGGRIGSLIGAPEGSVVVADSTSVNLFKALTAALALRPERRIILSDNGNFPTDLYVAQELAAWRGRGCELRCVAPEDVEAAIDDSVAVLMLTEVDYRTARRHDMKALTARAHKDGALTIWDLAHSAGALPVDLAGADADFAVGCTYKYLNGGPGAPAYVYVRPDLAEACRPALGGWMGHAAPFDFDQAYRPAHGVERFRVGTPSILSMSALDTALDVWDGVDMNDIRERSVALTELFITETEKRCARHGVRLASPRDPEMRGSHVSLRFTEGYAAMQALIASNIIGDFRAPDLMRFGFAPLYNSEDDVLAAAHRLEQILRERMWDRTEFKRRARVT